MIETVKKPSAGRFYSLVNDSKKELLFCAPYIKKEVVKDILKNKKPGVSLYVITCSKIANFVSGSLDIEALRLLLKEKAKIINWGNLHAKIYVFDKKKALVTSANMTNNALYNNYEYGLLVDEKEKYVVNQIRADFLEMIRSKNGRKITNKTLDRNEIDVKKLKKKRSLVTVDEEGEEVLCLKKATDLKTLLNSWEKDVFSCLNRIQSVTFTLKEVYAFVPELQKNHPTNHHVEEKIRQTLQCLRDGGYIRFETPGHYKKLWKM